MGSTFSAGSPVTSRTSPSVSAIAPPFGSSSGGGGTTVTSVLLIFVAGRTVDGLPPGVVPSRARFIRAGGFFVERLLEGMRDVLASAPRSVKRLLSSERALAGLAFADLEAIGLAFWAPAFLMRGRDAPRAERGFTEAGIRGAVCVVFLSFLGRADDRVLRAVAMPLPLLCSLLGDFGITPSFLQNSYNS